MKTKDQQQWLGWVWDRFSGNFVLREKRPRFPRDAGREERMEILEKSLDTLSKDRVAADLLYEALMNENGTLEQIQKLFEIRDSIIHDEYAGHTMAYWAVRSRDLAKVELMNLLGADFTQLSRENRYSALNQAQLQFDEHPRDLFEDDLKDLALSDIAKMDTDAKILEIASWHLITKINYSPEELTPEDVLATLPLQDQDLFEQALRVRPDLLNKKVDGVPLIIGVGRFGTKEHLQIIDKLGGNLKATDHNGFTVLDYAKRRYDRYGDVEGKAMCIYLAKKGVHGQPHQRKRWEPLNGMASNARPAAYARTL